MAARTPEGRDAAPLAALAAGPDPRTGGATAMLAFAGAVVVATEFIVVGLLPFMARDLGLSLQQTGRLVTWFALSAAVFGPALTIAAGRWTPRRVVTLTLAPFALGNLLAAAVPSYPVLSTVRAVEGAVLPVFISIGNTALVNLAGPGREGRAIARVNLGVIAGIVLAVPAGVALAERTGWRAIFVGLAVLTAIAGLIVVTRFPRMERPGPAGMLVQAAILRRPRVQAHLLLSAVLFTAMFASYTYLAAFLEAVAGFGDKGVAATLFGFGLAGLFGNWMAGRLVDGGPSAATAGAALILVVRRRRLRR